MEVIERTVATSIAKHFEALQDTNDASAAVNPTNTEANIVNAIGEMTIDATNTERYIETVGACAVIESGGAKGVIEIEGAEAVNESEGAKANIAADCSFLPIKSGEDSLLGVLEVYLTNLANVEDLVSE